MIIFTTILLVTNMLVTHFFGFVYTNTAAIYSLLALLIFAAVGMMFLQSTRKYSSLALIITILLYAGIEILAPYTVAIAWIISAIIAIAVTVNIKKPMLSMVKRNSSTMPTWCRILLSIV